MARDETGAEDNINWIDNFRARYRTRRRVVGPPPNEWYHRWRVHLLLFTLYEISAVMQHGIAAMDFATIMRWFLLPMGAIAGGLGVYFVKFVIDKLAYYLSPTMMWILAIAIVLGGPDLLPPLTLANGPEKLEDRLKWTALFMFIQFSPYLPNFLKGYEVPSSFNAMMILSGIWYVMIFPC